MPLVGCQSTFSWWTTPSRSRYSTTSALRGVDAGRYGEFWLQGIAIGILHGVNWPVGMATGPDQTRDYPTPSLCSRLRTRLASRAQALHCLQAIGLVEHIDGSPISQCWDHTSKPTVQPRPCIKTGFRSEEHTSE